MGLAFVRKIILSLAIISLFGCNSISDEDVQYAKERAYCAGMRYASATLSPFGTSSTESEIAIATARLLTEQTIDAELKSRFNDGYNKSKMVIEDLQLKNKSELPTSEIVSNEASMRSQGRVCDREVKISQSTYDKLGSFSNSDLYENAVEDLNSWLTN